MATLSQAVQVFDKSETDGISISAVLLGNNDLEDVFHELVDSTSLNDNHKQLLFTLLMDYSDIFAISKDQLGRTDILLHEIVTENVSPIHQKFRRLSPYQREAV